METIYYGHVPPARDRRPSEGRPEVVLRATQGVRNNIPYKILIKITLDRDLRFIVVFWEVFLAKQEV